MAQDENAVREAILSELAVVWRNVGESLASRPPGDTRMDFIAVSELSDADWSRGQCRGEEIAFFRFDDDGLVQLASQVEIDLREPRRGQYFRIGRANFHVSGDRQRGALRYQVGPRSGRGLVYELHADGVTRTTKLVS